MRWASILLFFSHWGLAEPLDSSESSASPRRVERLVLWRPDVKGIRYVIPKLINETAAEMMSRWQSALKKSATYSQMQHTQNVSLSTDRSTFLPISSSSFEHPNVVVILNRPSQMTTAASYIKTVLDSFEKEGPRLFAVPLGLELVLTPDELLEFRKLLNEFDGQLGVGGDDPHPHLYGEKTLGLTEGDISVERDLIQSAYMQEYLENGKGRVFYICGSMQRAAIQDGWGFHPDVSALSATPQRSHDGVVLVEVQVDPDSELALAAGSIRFQTSNFHHAGINESVTLPGKNPMSRITAYNIEPDGTRGKIVKSIEFPDNRGFATQFHPEFRGSKEEERIIKYVATGWQMRARVGAQAILKCMERTRAPNAVKKVN